MDRSIYVAISDYSPEAIEMLKEISSEIIVRKESERPSIRELSKLVRKYDILIIGAKEQMTSEVYSNATKLKILGTLSIGVDHIDKSFFDDKTIEVINCPHSNVVSVAEHTFSLILALSKRLFEAHTATCSLKGRQGMRGLPYDIFRKCIGVIGAGKIGTKVMKIAQAFEMKILCYTFHPDKHTNLEDLGVKFVSLDELFTTSDVVTIHIPLTDLSKGLISSELIEKMKKNAILINTSRSEIVDNIALANALRNNKILGAGIDINIGDSETVSVLKIFNNVILTPHSAGVTKESITRMDTDLASYIIERVKSKK